MSAQVVSVRLTQLYHEVRTREVEDGWVEPEKLDQPYPYRIPAGVEYELGFANGERRTGWTKLGEILLENTRMYGEGSRHITVDGERYLVCPDATYQTDHRAIRN